ncbi:hypothetical protein OTK49_02665 [Vibrio coralliirubri]|uniref:hypothetical protein n=1 Tax=Vibrio coralliirubri TaxID=1516159 RepID=UPI0022836281|nr:hypothetical protein [Vibrio coralliirubri]MCY9861420.1 hypothetical protein [Vibrio coralliirubri]
MKVDYRLEIDSNHLDCVKMEKLAKTIHTHFAAGSFIDLDKSHAPTPELDGYIGKRYKVCPYAGSLKPTFDGRFRTMVIVSLTSLN